MRVAVSPLTRSSGHPRLRGRTALLTAGAMVAFAANSVLCRLALGREAIDAASFATVRLVSGAAALGVTRFFVRGQGSSGTGGTWFEASMLFLYAVAFSFAYVSLSASAGALILFASVQTTMIFAGLRAGERPDVREWLGLLLALGGLVGLVLPGLTAPSPTGSVLMAVAGVAWGAYSLRGRRAVNPVTSTRDNFIRAVPLVLMVGLICLPARHWSTEGLVLAVLSGAGASGLGYVIWYAALPDLTATRAAIVQLSVPVLAAVGGVLFLSESISMRLVSAAIAILGGVTLAALGRPGIAGSSSGTA